MGDLDCGDNSCLFAWKKGGMRTNGGCRCLQDLPTELRRDVQLWAQKAKRLIKTARAEGRAEVVAVVRRRLERHRTESMDWKAEEELAGLLAEIGEEG